MEIHYTLPRFITFNEINQMLQRGEIKTWFINPASQNPSDAPNVKISFVTNNGEHYLVKAKYDPETKQMFPPVETVTSPITDLENSCSMTINPTELSTKREGIRGNIPRIPVPPLANYANVLRGMSINESPTMWDNVYSNTPRIPVLPLMKCENVDKTRKVPVIKIDPNDTLLGEILRSITSRKSWYKKIFLPEIVNKWGKEIVMECSSPDFYTKRNEQPWRFEFNTDTSHVLGACETPEPLEEFKAVNNNSLQYVTDLFSLAVNLLRATAQGCFHSKDCEWEEPNPDRICDTCLESKREKIIRAAKGDDVKELEVPKADCSLDELREILRTLYYEFDIEIRNSCTHHCCCIPPDYRLEKYINYQGPETNELFSRLKEQIRIISEELPIDWHPGSSERVRDLVHPSLYCYVKGTSTLSNGQKEEIGEEALRYQWLPTEVQITSHSVSFNSYINNLPNKFAVNLVPLLEQLLANFLPRLEKVIPNHFKQGITSNLQVIVKISTISLNQEKPNNPIGSWHLEGMPYEHIVATCIQYLEMDGITDSYLEFRKPVYINEENIEYSQGDETFTTHHYGIDEHYDGHMNKYLGLTRCVEGASVVFPNTLQHRVKEFELEEGFKSGVRTIIAFFIVDPTRRITSTLDVKPQQQIFSEEEANHFRERLMLHRKYYINALNEVVFERSFSLCEH